MNHLPIKTFYMSNCSHCRKKKSPKHTTETPRCQKFNYFSDFYLDELVARNIYFWLALLQNFYEAQGLEAILLSMWELSKLSKLELRRVCVCIAYNRRGKIYLLSNELKESYVARSD